MKLMNGIVEYSRVAATHTVPISKTGSSRSRRQSTATCRAATPTITTTGRTSRRDSSSTSATVAAPASTTPASPVRGPSHPRARGRARRRTPDGASAAAAASATARPPRHRAAPRGPSSDRLIRLDPGSHRPPAPRGELLLFRLDQLLQRGGKRARDRPLREVRLQLAEIRDVADVVAGPVPLVVGPRDLVPANLADEGEALEDRRRV